MAIRIRVYPQPWSVGARRNRAIRQQQQLQTQLMLQRQMQASQYGGWQSPLQTGYGSSWNSPWQSRFGSWSAGAGSVGCAPAWGSSYGSNHAAMSGSAWLGSPYLSAPAHSTSWGAAPFGAWSSMQRWW